MKSLVSIAPADLAAAWPRLRADIASIESPDGWLIEDVYCALKMGGASLYLTVVDDVERGFVVLRQVKDFDGDRLHIWLLFNRGKADVMAEFSDELDVLARRINARKLTFSSTRPGWARVAPKHGFAVREVTFQRTVKP